MNPPDQHDPKKSGYPEDQPRRRDGDESHPSPTTPHEPQNTPEKKPTPSSG